MAEARAEYPTCTSVAAAIITTGGIMQEPEKHDTKMGPSDHLHRVTGFVLGLMGPVSFMAIYMVVQREWLQEEEKKRINRAGFDLKIWLSGYIPGLIGFCVWVAALAWVLAK